MSEYVVTPRQVYENSRALISASRRRFLTRSSTAMLAAGLAPSTLWAGDKIADYLASESALKSELTPYEYVTSYNNF